MSRLDLRQTGGGPRIAGHGTSGGGGIGSSASTEGLATCRGEYAGDADLQSVFTEAMKLRRRTENVWVSLPV